MPKNETQSRETMQASYDILAAKKNTTGLTDEEQNQFENLYVLLNTEQKSEKEKPAHKEPTPEELAAKAEAEAKALAEHEKELKGPTADGYVPAKGTENQLHLKLSRGIRFDPMTGKPIGESFVQVFNHSEWLSIKNSIEQWPMHVDEILYDPFNATEVLVAHQPDLAKTNKE